MLTTTEYKIEVMKAFQEGKVIQCRSNSELRIPRDPWGNCPNPAWNWASMEYRVKPEPLVRYARRFHSDGRVGSTLFTEEYVREFPFKEPGGSPLGFSWVRFVMDEGEG